MHRNPRSGAAYVGTPEVVEGDPGVRERNASVCWTGESYRIGFAEQVGGGSDYDLRVASVELLACRPCEAELFVGTAQNGFGHDVRLAIARHEASPTSVGLWVWENNEVPQVGAFTTADGAVRSLGGGCGDGGRAAATCAAVGAPAFGMGLRHAAPSASGWLVLGAGPRLEFACGTCRLIPNPVVALPIVTDALGNAGVSVALSSNPSLRGATFDAQWIVLAPSGCPALGASFSDGIEIRIE